MIAQVNNNDCTRENLTFTHWFGGSSNCNGFTGTGIILSREKMHKSNIFIINL